MAESPAKPDLLIEAWQNVLDQWDDPESHRKFISISNALGRLPEAGKCYREIRETDSERKLEAERRIRTIVILATEQLALAKQGPTGFSPRSVRWLALFVSAALLLFALFQYWRAR